MTDQELLSAAAFRGVKELGEECYLVFASEFVGVTGDWRALSPNERNAWRAAAAHVWKMAR